MNAVAPLSKWSTRPLDDFFEIVGGGTPSKNEPTYWGGNIRWASIRDMHSAELSSTEFAITERGLQNSSTKIIPAGEVIMASRVGLGKACVLMQDTAINQDIRALIPRRPDKIEPRFCLYWLQSIADVIADAGSGATVKGVKLPFIKSLPFPDIELEEQKRIVAVLDQAFAPLDRAHAYSKANVANATDLLNQAREQLLSLDQPGWEEVPLSSLIEIKHGFAFKSEFFQNDGKYVLLTPGNFFEGGGFRHRGSKQKYYVGEIPDGFVLNEGDLLMAMTEQAPGLLGSCILVPEDNRFLHNQRLGLIQPKRPEKWHSPYFAHVFNLKAFRKALSDTCSGIKVRHTSPEKILRVKVPVPPSVDVQKSVADQIERVTTNTMTLTQKYSDKLTQIGALRKSLLDRAFSGYLT